MQAFQMVVISGAGFRKDPPVVYHLGHDEPVYGGPLNKRPYNKSGNELLKRLGLHGFTCVEYIRDPFAPPVGNLRSDRIEKRLVVVHYIHVGE